MKIGKEEIVGWASRYVSVEGANFPLEDDLFLFLSRKIIPNKIMKDSEGWQFSGYGLCTGYDSDDSVRPEGKWIFMNYCDLTSHPLEERSLRLQPPHVTKGRFYSQDRSLEIQLVKCQLPHKTPITEEVPEDLEKQGNILKFKPKKIV